MATLTQINALKNKVSKMSKLPSAHKLFINAFIESLGNKKIANKSLTGVLSVEDYQSISKSFMSYNWETDKEEFCFDRLEAFINGYFKANPERFYPSERTITRFDGNGEPYTEEVPDAYSL